ncbi:hypothetical protein ACFLUJ_04175 [Chloroflexota bacterium]
MVGAFRGIVALLIISPSLSATELHEDPEEARLAFSGISCQHRPTDKDMGKYKQLSHTVEEELKHEDV